MSSHWKQLLSLLLRPFRTSPQTENENKPDAADENDEDKADRQHDDCVQAVHVQLRRQPLKAKGMFWPQLD